MDGSLLAEIGPTGFERVQSLAFDPVSGDLYAHGDVVPLNSSGNSMASDSIGRFYTTGYSGDGEALLRFDADTLLVTSMGSLGSSDYPALAFDAGDRLFAVTGRGQSPSTLDEIDPATGALIQSIGDTGEDGVVAMDFHPGTGVLYGHANGPTFNGNNTFAIDSNGVAYAHNRDRGTLVSINLTNGDMLDLGPLPFYDIVALAFDASDRLFATTGSGGSASRLLEINPLSGGLIQDFGPIGFNGVTGLAFHPVSNVLYGHAQLPTNLSLSMPPTVWAPSLGKSTVSGNVADIGV